MRHSWPWVCALWLLWPQLAASAPAPGDFTLTAAQITPEVITWGPHCGARPSATTGVSAARYRWTPAAGLTPLDGAPALLSPAACAGITGIPELRGEVSEGALRCASPAGAAQQSQGEGRVQWLGPDRLRVIHTFTHDWQLKGSRCSVRQRHVATLTRLAPPAAPAEVTSAPPTGEASSPKHSARARPAEPAVDLTALTPTPPRLSPSVTEGEASVAPAPAAADTFDAVEPEGRPIWLLWAVLLMALAGASVGGWLLWRAWPRRRRDLAHPPRPPHRSPSTSEQTAQIQGGNTTPPQSSAGVEGVELQLSASTPEITFTSGALNDAGICPHCQRHFDAMTAYCPFDGHALQHLGHFDHAEVEVEQARVCGHCMALWPASLTHCPEDGAPLHEAGADQPAAGGRICPQCGARGQDHVAHCPRDGADTVTLN